jgi:hypothetical protein
LVIFVAPPAPPSKFEFDEVGTGPGETGVSAGIAGTAVAVRRAAAKAANLEMGFFDSGAGFAVMALRLVADAGDWEEEWGRPAKAAREDGFFGCVAVDVDKGRADAAFGSDCPD